MSVKKNVKEAARWLKTAEDDLDSAVILKKNDKFAHACFHAQQVGEKALKAVWYYADADPWGHSIKRLIEELKHVDLNLFNHLETLIRSGMILDRFYIPTRYPNGLPDLTPEEAYIDEDAKVCIEHANLIVNTVRSFLNIQA